VPQEIAAKGGAVVNRRKHRGVPLNPTALRLQLARTGYLPIPLFGKEPPVYGKNNKVKGLAGWQNLEVVTGEQIRMWDKTWPDAVNTGGLTRRVPAIDIDILHPEAADTIEHFTRGWFERRGRILVRTGLAPKRAILLRTDQPFEKIVRKFIAPDGSEHKIEILSDGQQLVYAGTHPDTQQLYTWHGGDPSTVKRSELPDVSESEAEKYLDDAAALLVKQFKFKLADVKRARHNKPNGHEKKTAWEQVGPTDRETAWAEAALQNVSAELRDTGKGDRNNKLYKCAFRMGTMIAREWIARDGVELELEKAATACGYVQDDGLKATRATIKSGIEGGLECPHDDLSNSGGSNTGSNTSATAAPVASPVVMIRAADVTMRPMEWLWEGHLARGALELTTGLPGVGKSQAQIHFMACASAGLLWPDGAPAIELVNVIMVTAEDAIDTQVVPRLSAAGADLKRIHILKYIKTDKLQRQFLLTEDLARLEQVVAQLGNVGLICIDPITAYMGGKIDAHKTTEVRSQLGPLKDFSEGTNVAVSAITHPAKNASARAIDHFIGSQAFIAAARIGHACFEEFEEEDEEGSGEKTPTGRILFTNVKYSAHRKMPTLAYKIETTYIHPEPFLQIETSRVVWEKEAVDISAEQAIAAMRSIAKAKAKEEEAASEVVDFLRSMIDAGGGWCKQTEIAAQAKALGFSDKELRTARKKLVVISKKDGFDGPWLWGWEGKRPIRF
jgi:AAA domain/Bifunctional DNA primase/polymerase, N-terminal